MLIFFYTTIIYNVDILMFSKKKLVVSIQGVPLNRFNVILLVIKRYISIAAPSLFFSCKDAILTAE